MPSVSSRQRTTSQSSADISHKRIDLNLLSVFDLVMTERHVSRAAQRLDMTQSAVSNALNRLRDQFQDRLFVKAARGVDPTPRAIELWPQIHDALEALRNAVQPQVFSPERHEQKYRLSMVDITVAMLASPLQNLISQQSPLSSLFVVPHDPVETGYRLMRGELDFAIGIDPPRASVIQNMPLWSDNFVVAARVGHPLMAGKISLADFCATPQIAVNEPGNLEALTGVDEALEESGLFRVIALTVNQFTVIPSILPASDLITVIPARFASLPGYRGVIAWQPLPFRIPEATVYLSWHQRVNESAAHLWMKQRILEAAVIVNKEHSKN